MHDRNRCSRLSPYSFVVPLYYRGKPILGRCNFAIQEPPKTGHVQDALAQRREIYRRPHRSIEDWPIRQGLSDAGPVGIVEKTRGLREKILFLQFDVQAVAVEECAEYVEDEIPRQGLVAHDPLHRPVRALRLTAKLGMRARKIRDLVGEVYDGRSSPHRWHPPSGDDMLRDNRGSNP